MSGDGDGDGDGDGVTTLSIIVNDSAGSPIGYLLGSDRYGLTVWVEKENIVIRIGANGEVGTSLNLDPGSNGHGVGYATDDCSSEVLIFNDSVCGYVSFGKPYVITFDTIFIGNDYFQDGSLVAIESAYYNAGDGACFSIPTADRCAVTAFASNLPLQYTPPFEFVPQ